MADYELTDNEDVIKETKTVEILISITDVKEDIAQVEKLLANAQALLIKLEEVKLASQTK